MAVILLAVELGIGLSGFVGWIVLWYITVTRGEKLLRPLFGEAAQVVCLIGYPFFIFGLLYVLMHVVPRDKHEELFITIGLALMALGLLTYWNLWKGKINL
jgi:hypothetical protein